MAERGSPTPPTSPSDRGEVAGVEWVPEPRSRWARKLLGPALPSSVESQERLSKPVALAILSSDALSSVAYATQEMLVVLVPAAGLAAFGATLPLAGLIIALLVTLTFSYRQTIRAYPTAGGAYVVTRDNFGILPAQVAGVALLTDYVMTVAISVAAGVAALYSYFPALFPYRIPAAVAFVVVIAWTNLRGVRIAGRAFAAPTYLFLVAIAALLGAGVVRALSGSLQPAPATTHLPAAGTSALTVFVLLHAYASGTTALTGVEAISNGVPVFRPVEWRNARAVLTWMGCILAVSFGGITLLAWRMRPLPTSSKTVISELGQALFGPSALGRATLLFLQVTTAGILVLAANTAFSDFPRLASFHATDGYLPRPLRRRGRRLSYSVGIVALAVLATTVVVVLGADVHRMIPLYAVGVFASFALSQAGMTRRHLRLREKGWRHGLAINALGAIGSGLALAAVVVAKFTAGAWVVLCLVPLGVALFARIHRHYETTDRRLTDLHGLPVDGIASVAIESDPPLLAGAAHRCLERFRGIADSPSRGPNPSTPATTTRPAVHITPFPVGRPPRRSRVPNRADVATGWLAIDRDHPCDDTAPSVAVVVVERLDWPSVRAVQLGQAVGADEVIAVHVDEDRAETSRLVDAWHAASLGVELQVLDAPFREPVGPVRRKLGLLRQAGPRPTVVIVPRIAPRWWQRPLYASAALHLRRGLADLSDVAVIELPYPLAATESAATLPGSARTPEEEQA